MPCAPRVFSLMPCLLISCRSRDARCLSGARARAASRVCKIFFCICSCLIHHGSFRLMPCSLVPWPPVMLAVSVAQLEPHLRKEGGHKGMWVTLQIGRNHAPLTRNAKITKQEKQTWRFSTHFGSVGDLGGHDLLCMGPALFVPISAANCRIE